MDSNDRGDPNGRRLAKTQAGLLAEAGRLARVLEILLTKAGMESAALKQLIRDITSREQQKLQIAFGRCR